jgi:hypothetical protein
MTETHPAELHEKLSQTSRPCRSRSPVGPFPLPGEVPGRARQEQRVTLPNATTRNGARGLLAITGGGVTALSLQQRGATEYSCPLQTRPLSGLSQFSWPFSLVLAQHPLRSLPRKRAGLANYPEIPAERPGMANKNETLQENVPDWPTRLRHIDERLSQSSWPAQVRASADGQLH